MGKNKSISDTNFVYLTLISETNIYIQKLSKKLNLNKKCFYQNLSKNQIHNK